MRVYKSLFIIIICLSAQLNIQAQVDSMYVDSIYNQDISFFHDSIIKDSNSIYFPTSIEALFNNKDTSISHNQLIAYNVSWRKEPQNNPLEIDKQCIELLQAIENKKFKKSIKIGRSILKVCPSNFTAHRELALAYRKIGDYTNAKYHELITIKLISAQMRFGNGSQERPFNMNNYAELMTYYEIVFRCKPDRAGFLKLKDGRILGALKCFSAGNNEIYIQYCDMTHCSPWLKEGDYTEQ